MAHEVLAAVTKDERETILNRLNEYVSYQTREFDDYFSIWAEQKKELFKIFGNRLILSKPVEIRVTPEILARSYVESQEFNELKCQIMNIFRELKKYNPDIFFKEAKGISYYHLFDYKNLAENIYNGPELWLSFSDGKIIKVRKGAKLMKTLAKIVAKINWKPLNDTFETFRLKHSMISNTKTLKGDLCLSIHPLDFMTLSDNSYNWSSCMNWLDGEYRIGTVEMLNSSNVVVGYLRGQEDESIEDLVLAKAYAKKWRSLFIVSDEVITNVKGYPYQSEVLSRLCVDWLKSLSKNEYSNDEIIVTSEKDNKTGENSIKHYINFDTNYMYNDMGLAKNFSYFKRPLSTYHYFDDYLNYSGPTQCFGCNCRYGEFSEPSSLICDNCSEADYIYCDWCEERIPIDSEYYFDDDESTPLCYDCYMEAAIDPVSRDIIFNAPHKAEIDLNIVLGDATEKELAALGYVSDEEIKERGWSDSFSFTKIINNPEERNMAKVHIFFENEHNWEAALEENRLFDSSKIYEARGRYCLPISALTDEGFFFATGYDNYKHGINYDYSARLPMMECYSTYSKKEQWDRYKMVLREPESFTLKELMGDDKDTF